jgi:multidrug efflux pump
MRLRWIPTALLAALSSAHAQSAPSEITMTVETRWAGASLAETERQVTAKLDNYLGAADGLKFSVSLTRPGHSRVVLKFKPGIGGAKAERSALAQLGRVRATLPAGIAEPTIATLETPEQPVAYLGFISDALAAVEVSRFVAREVVARLETVEGVAEVRVFGSWEERLEIRLERRRLTDYRVAPGDVEAALRGLGIGFRPGGSTDDEHVLVVTPSARVTNEALFKLVVKADGPVRLGDLGRIALAPESDGVRAHFDGTPAVLVIVTARPGGDPLAAARALRAHVTEIELRRPGTIKLKAGFSCELCAGAGAR